MLPLTATFIGPSSIQSQKWLIVPPNNIDHEHELFSGSALFHQVILIMNMFTCCFRLCIVSPSYIDNEHVHMSFQAVRCSTKLYQS